MVGRRRLGGSRLGHAPFGRLRARYCGRGSRDPTSLVGRKTCSEFGHPALDLVLVAKDAEGGLFISGLWDLIRPALVEHDPVYQGDMEAFCRDYAAGAYAPDLIPLP